MELCCFSYLKIIFITSGQNAFDHTSMDIGQAPLDSVVVPAKPFVIEPEQEAEISVYDCGPGVNPTETGNLFKRFFRTHSARYHQTMGYGLGLAICKNIIDQHQETIGYERTFEAKTRLYFTHPP